MHFRLRQTLGALGGAGADRSVLNFKDQIAGAEGLLVTANDFSISDLAIEDTAGDALPSSLVT